MFRSAVVCEEVRIMGEKHAKNKVQTNHKKASTGLSKYYLILYNFLQTIGWIILLLQLVQYYTDSSLRSKTSLYEHVKWSLVVFQNAAVLEILHAIIRIVPSSPLITAQQVSSRVIVVCGVLVPTVAARQSIGLPLALTAWSITEIIRYANYTLNLMKAVPHFLVWLRYSTFIVLYPLGVTGELLCIYAAQKEAGETGLFSIDMPNTLNVVFYYNYFLIFIMSLYLPLFPQLYMHMFSQRRKVLGSPASSENGFLKKVQ